MAEPKMTKVEIITRPEKLDDLKTVLNDIGITGMTVSQVMGCGTQKGRKQIFRGITYEINLIPKIKVETVISKVPVNDVIEAAKKVLYTGKIGDGKIFVYDVEKVVRIRTGEEDYAALQYEHE